MKLLNFFVDLFSSSADICDIDDDMVIFAGADKGFSEGSIDGEYDFSIYVTGVLLPASTTDENVIEQLINMKLGQIFKIVSEGDGGPIGVVVEAIEFNDDMPVYKVPSDIPMFLKL